MPEVQSVDPAVTRAKFDREVGRFRETEAIYRQRGVLMQEVAFPTVTIGFCATKISPPVILGAVRIDFTDYDLQPPSVTFVDPFTHRELGPREIALPLLRFPKRDGMTRAEIMTAATQGVPVELIPLVMAADELGKPFLCLPGVREYHDNPAHSGDPWLLHRASGEGCLAFIIDNIWKYGPNAIETFAVNLMVPGPGGPGTLVPMLFQMKQVGFSPGIDAVSE